MANLDKTSVVIDLLGLTVFQATEKLLNTVMVEYYWTPHSESNLRFLEGKILQIMNVLLPTFFINFTRTSMRGFPLEALINVLESRWKVIFFVFTKWRRYQPSGGLITDPRKRIVIWPAIKSKCHLVLEKQTLVVLLPAVFQSQQAS